MAPFVRAADEHAAGREGQNGLLDGARVQAQGGGEAGAAGVDAELLRGARRAEQLAEQQVQHRALAGR
ncbi:MAG: hypothetical protein JNM72_22005 [Deltaproteobacteria bacterium]|nr:hypothetical protein [Deltaproteobacteria bacterium]